MKLRKVSQAHDILISEEVQRSRNKPQILLGGKVYYRFMDVLYVPDHVYRLSPQFVAELNRIRDELSGLVIDVEYNEAIYTSILRAVGDMVPAPRTILDFGCGIGSAGKFIHSTFPGARIHGFDIRPVETVSPYVDIASAEATESLPYPDASFDACLAFFVLHFHISSLQLNEIFRTLRPGAAFAFNLINSADYEVLDRIHERGFLLQTDIEIETASNSGRGFVFRKEAPEAAERSNA